MGDLQADTLQEVEATLNLIQGTKRFSEIPFYMQQQQQHQQQPHYQLQQRIGSAAFYVAQKHFPVQQQQHEYYLGHPAGPFEPVCHIKQEANDDHLPPPQQHQQLQLLGSSTLYATPDCYTDTVAESYIDNLQSYFDANVGSSNVASKIDEIVKPVDTDPLRRIMTDFDRAASSSLAQESDLVRTLLNFHCNSGRISKFDARRLITCLAETFRQFAASQPAFQSISSADQFRLLVIIVYLIRKKKGVVSFLALT